MSASLVGSEMCIRDRSVGRTIASLAASLAYRRKRGTTFVSATLLSPVAVSYTHLTLPTICSV
eukprot:4337677-Alexandrium_andersonii.AAC.1